MGDAELTADNTSYLADLTLNGGPDSDTLTASNISVAGELEEKNFEIFP